MKSNQTIYEVTSRILLGTKDVMEEFSPHYILVHGDTTTSMASSIAAFYQQIKIGHVEAGLRTNNLYSPFPEEANRQIISVLSDINFVPTIESKSNLIKENKTNIYVTGNTVIDALFFTIKKFKEDKLFEERAVKTIEKEYKFHDKRKIILVTGHRRENFGDGFINICNALKEIANNNKDIDIVYPVHLNPNVRKPVNKLLNDIKNIYLIKPLAYDNFIYLMQKSYIIITDSGGIQEEAPAIGKPVLVMRDTSERPEAISAGTAKLVGTNIENIVKECEQLICNEESYKEMSMAHNPYGDGFSSQRIIEAIYQDYQ